MLDVADVPGGKGCGCVCPSCKTPLIARHGEVKEWHFAHASRAVYARTQKLCSYSFYMSVRLMARQIIGKELTMAFPAYTDFVGEYYSGLDQYISESFTVTPAQKLTLSDVEVEKGFLSVPVDIFGHIGEFSFIIYFTHPGRTVPPELKHPADTHCGIVSVTLEPLAELFRRAKKTGRSYHKILRNFLVHDTSSKTWVFHPRYKTCQEQAQQRLQQKSIESKAAADIAREKFRESARERAKERQREKERKLRSIYSVPVVEKKVNTPPIIEVPKRLAIYECVLCHIGWQDWEPGASVCPKCNSHLYRTLKGYVDEES